MSIENISNIMFSAGAGAVIGFLTGFALKRIIKIISVIIGIFLAALIYFQSQNILTINWDKLQAIFNSILSSLGNILTNTQPLSTIVGNLGIPLTGGLSAGFILGFIKG